MFRSTTLALRVTLALLAFGWTAMGGVTTRVSVDSSGAEANQYSQYAQLSADGRFLVFDSEASNLVPGDTNDRRDIFLKDLTTGEVVRLSVDSQGHEADAGSYHPVISADGAVIAFISFADNLVPDDTNDALDLFVVDRRTMQIRRASVDSSGVQANAATDYSKIAVSADGRMVAFACDASNLVPDDTNGVGDVFVHDLESGETTRVSVGSGGIEADEPSFLPSLSGDGRLVSFTSYAHNLVPGTTALMDVYVHDRWTGVTELVSLSSSGEVGNGASADGSISDDGRVIAFGSDATNFLEDDVNGSNSDVFVHDRLTGETRLVSVDVDGRQFPSVSTFSGAGGAMITGDGRFVAFAEMFQFLDFRVYVHEVATNLTTMVCVNSAGDEANHSANYPSLSGDGRLCVFSSDADNLVPDDDNRVSDVFLNRRATLRLDGTPASASPVSFSLLDGEVDDLALVLVSASGTNGFRLAGRWLPLTLDAVTIAGLQALPLLSARVDATGTATTPVFAFPPIDPGVTFHATALTIDGTGAIESVTSPVAIVTQ